jgi:hypothetical protein
MAALVCRGAARQCYQSVTAEHRLKETAMPAKRFERIALAQLLLSGCAVMFGVCVLIKLAQAQPGYVPPPTPLPPPVFNPSSPNTVPQPSYRPITPRTPSTIPSSPSTVPSSEVRSPADEGLPRRAARSHRRASVYGAGPVYRAGPIVTGPPPAAYSYIGFGYPCAWQRSWDGYWFRTSPCSW